jgi:hypothetical protein
VKNPLHSGKRALQRRRIAQIAGDIFERKISNRTVVARWTKKYPYIRPARCKLSR